MRFGNAITDIELSPHKYLLHADRLQKLARGEDVHPVTVELDLVDYCNHRCGWCVDPRHGHSSLEEAAATRLLDELRELGVRGIVYKGGGEPTLHRSFPALLEAARLREFEAGVVTNGSRLATMAEPVANHASYLRVSIDGPTPESHRVVHGTDDFAAIVRGVEAVVAERAKRKQRHPVVGLSFAMDYALIDLVGEAIALGDRLGVDYVLFRTPFFAEAGREPTMTVEQACEVREAFDRSQRHHRGAMRVMVDHWISDRDAQVMGNAAGPSPRGGAYYGAGANGIEHVTGRCLASPLLAVVAGDGSVYPCCNLRFLDDWCIGRIDLDRGIGFRQVWEGEQRRRVLARIHRTECVQYCTHPMSKYNEAIEYLRGPRYHGSFV